MKNIIIVPCYNEKNRINLHLFEKFSQIEEKTSFLFVDDGSTDRTVDAINSLVSINPTRFLLHRLPENSGKAEAIRRGMLEAFKLEAQFVGMWDADLATPLEEIPRFLNILNSSPEVLMVMGARVQMLGRRIERNAARHYLGRVSATLISLALDLPCYDTQCGAKIFRLTNDIKTLFAEPFISRWIFDVEVLARIKSLSRKDKSIHPAKSVFELPLLEWHDKPGSSLKAADYFFSLLDLYKIWRKYRKKQN